MKRFVFSTDWAPVCSAGLVALLVGVLPATAAQPGFEEVASDLGLDFTHTVMTDTPGWEMHGGGTPGDFNNDDWPDLFVVGGALQPDKLFINDGDGTFTEAGAAWGVDRTHRGNGANAADFNNDGLMDIFVTSFGPADGAAANGGHLLYKNNGDGTFTDVAVSAGVNETGPFADGYGSTWGDYDHDGDLDLWVAGWHGKTQDAEEIPGNRLFRNNGDETFTDVSEESGAFILATKGFGGIFVDMDGDRYEELLVAGDFGTSRYFLNNRDGTFSTEPVLLNGTDKVHNGMGTTTGDFDRDGRQDWFVTAIYPAFHLEGPDGNRMYYNRRGGIDDHGLEMAPFGGGVNDGGWGWGAAAIDFDNDGWLDVAHTNGWRRCDMITDECFEDEPTYLFQNAGDGTFTEVGEFYGIESRQQGRGLIDWDPDRDGDQDITVFSNEGVLQHFRNVLSGDDANWIKVKLDRGDNPAIAPNGLGANVAVKTGNVTQSYRANAGSNYLSRSELVAHFGIRGALDIDEIVVQWNDGFRTVLTDVAINQEITITAPTPLTAVGDAVPGEPFEMAIEGLQAGEEVNFFGAMAVGDGPCQNDWACLDIVNPRRLGSSIVDADGTATFNTQPLPAGAFGTFYVQAFVDRMEGLSSVKSNVIEVPVSVPLQ